MQDFISVRLFQNCTDDRRSKSARECPARKRVLDRGHQDRNQQSAVFVLSQRLFWPMAHVMRFWSEEECPNVQSYYRNTKVHEEVIVIILNNRL